jgi:Tol biopolymer transport system component
MGVITVDGICIVDRDSCSIYSNNINWTGSYSYLSPDGSQILKSFFQIYVKNVDGSGEQQLTFIEHPTSSAAIGAAWSPDGAYIAFRSAHEGWLALYVMNSDGSDISQIANRVSWFAWQPAVN